MILKPKAAILKSSPQLIYRESEIETTRFDHRAREEEIRRREELLRERERFLAEAEAVRRREPSPRLRRRSPSPRYLDDPPRRAAADLPPFSERAEPGASGTNQGRRHGSYNSAVRRSPSPPVGYSARVAPPLDDYPLSSKDRYGLGPDRLMPRSPSPRRSHFDDFQDSRRGYSDKRSLSPSYESSRYPHKQSRYDDHRNY